MKHLDEGEIVEVLNETEPGESKFVENVSFSDLQREPNLYVHPIPEHLQEKNGDATHMEFLTDLTHDDINMEELYKTYQSRWTIETIFCQINNGLNPETESPSPEMRLFTLSVAMLFFNMHTLMNRAVAPEYALRLDVPHYSVLQAIVHSTFTRSGALEP